MTFYEQRLDLGINYGATFGPRFNTAVLTQSDGQEQRRALWSQPLILAQLGDRRVTQSELNTLLAFHATVKGAAIGFRLRDWSDYKATNQAIGTGNGTVQTWQLVKTYSISTATVTRPITKPVAGSVVVYVDGVEEENGWSVDTTTGVLTTELTGAIAVDFEFDVPVRFEQDKIDFTFEAKGLFTLAPLTCTEIRVEPTIYPALDTLPGSLEEIIDLGYDFGTLGGPSFSTGIKANGAEFELRKPRWESSLGSWDIGDRLLIRSELDYLIRLFRVCRGMAIPFRFKDWQTNTVQDVRFAEDRISFRFEAYSEAEVIFNLGGMAVTAIGPIDPPTGLFYVYSNIQGRNGDIWPSGNCSRPITVKNITPFSYDPNVLTSVNALLNDIINVNPASFSVDSQGFVVLTYGGQSSRMDFKGSDDPSSAPWIREVLTQGGLIYSADCINTPGYVNGGQPIYGKYNDDGFLNTANPITIEYV